MTNPTSLFSTRNPQSLVSRARRRRWLELCDRFPDLASMKVLDLGGLPWAWHRSPVRPASLTLVNLDAVRTKDKSVRAFVGDACDLPVELRGERFDLVYSNSVIEHVGGRARRQAFAETVATTADRHWIQTPAPTFPFEPHWLFPGFQYLPVSARVAITKRWPWGHVAAERKKPGAAIGAVLSVDLVSLGELRDLFPNSEIVRERFALLTKSYIAVKS